MWKIGSVSIENRIVAAPLAGISNPVYRSMCRQYGAGLVVSEMISDKALHYENKKTKEMCATVSDEHPVSLQLFGSDPETMGEASRYLSEHTDCDIIDINMGCPVTKVIKAHAGSWLMQNEDLAQILGTYQHTTTPTVQHPEGLLLTSTVFSRMEGSESGTCTVLGGKTGYTVHGGQCLATYAESRTTGEGFVCVTAKGETKWRPVYDSIYLYQYYTGAVLPTEPPLPATPAE